MCIRIIGTSNRRYAHIGDVIVAVIKEAVPNMPLQRSEVIRAVIAKGGLYNIYITPPPLVDTSRGLSGMKEQKLIHEGLITESLPNGMFRVRLDNEDLILDIRGRVVSWSSAGTCGFRGTRRGTPFAAQTAAGNAIRTVVDQGMQRAEVMIKGPGLGRDAALRAIRRSGQADTIGIAIRRALLGEIYGTCITRVKSEKILHDYSTIVGIEESVHEIFMNLKEIVLQSNLYGTRDASICVKGPRCVTAQDIIPPPSVEIVDTTQHIATLTEPISFCIGLQIERNRGYRMKIPNNAQNGSYPIDAVFMPVRNANYSIHSYGNGNEKQEILFLEIWTNGSLTPKEALHEASQKQKHPNTGYNRYGIESSKPPLS
ncbi:hypothetical protein Syun_031722 [Stephania yunnanensis]|uniref:DNA-directed RNA polymerase n=1 Tax=Stephania yunnanensis TaxID=152371 RepID=A0AAP0DW92_9MAGN